MVYTDVILADKRTESLIRSYIPEEDSLEKLSGLFSVLSDPTRLKLLSALSISSLCVTDLSALLKLNQTTVSHQLRTLKGCGAVGCRRQGKISFYYIKNQNVLELLSNAAGLI